MPHNERLRQYVLDTKITPPRANRRTMARARLVEKLKEALEYRLTILQAPVGYGKTTALAAFAERLAQASGIRVAWYTITEDDVDPERFLAHLIAAVQRALPTLAESTMVALDQAARAPADHDWRRVIDTLINAIAQANLGDHPLVLIEEDYHLISRTRTVTDLQERLVNYMPVAMHVLVSVRHQLDDPALTAWRARGEVLDIGPADLTFSIADIKTLFADVLGTPLSEADALFIAEKTEGFPMALQSVWQALRAGGAPRGVHDILQFSAEGDADSSPSLRTLFDVLTRNVLNDLRPELRDFLRATSILRALSPAACDALTGDKGTAARTLQRLHNQGLFIVSVGQRQYRYHALFQEFLHSQLSAEEALGLHRRAAAYYRQAGQMQEALYHAFAAGDVEQAAKDLVQFGEQALQSGQIETLNERITALPSKLLIKHPRLQLYLGDICRMRNRFKEAQAWYTQAEELWRARGDRSGISQAMRAKAMVHLDTMQPALAQEMLEQAIALSEGISDQLTHARTLEMLAENKLNLGFPDEAERLRQQAQALRSGNSSEDALSVRVKIRTGRLNEARAVLEQWAAAEQFSKKGRFPHSYRETKLLLAFVHVLQGEVERALPLINASIELGNLHNLPFVSAMAQVRFGDARQLMTDEHGMADAVRAYRSAISTGKQLAVVRVQATASRGLARAYGVSGDLDAARLVAREGVALSKEVGDGWMAAHVELALGSALAFAHQHAEAIEVLRRAVEGFRGVGDEFCLAAAWLWLALAYHESGQPEHASAALNEALSRCLAQGYDFLLTRLSLLASPDLRRMFPLLAQISAHGTNRHARYAAQLLAAAGLPKLELHPGYQLRVFTLGEFRVWRGRQEIQSSDWQRDKARQLFQLFVALSGRRLQREEITAMLWAEAKPDAAWRDFRVALNALFKALEPNRTADAPSAYIGRDGSTYFLRPEADIWIDAVVLERAYDAAAKASDDSATSAAMIALEGALTESAGDYLAETPGEAWATAERARLKTLTIRSMETVAAYKLSQDQAAEAIHWCEQILKRDSCWENAYRIAIHAHIAHGNRAQAMRVFERCMNTLRDELGVSPSPQTLAVYERLHSNL